MLGGCAHLCLCARRGLGGLCLSRHTLPRFSHDVYDVFYVLDRWMDISDVCVVPPLGPCRWWSQPSKWMRAVLWTAQIGQVGILTACLHCTLGALADTTGCSRPAGFCSCRPGLARISQALKVRLFAAPEPCSVSPTGYSLSLHPSAPCPRSLQRAALVLHLAAP